jgi:hypothetical protein
MKCHKHTDGQHKKREKKKQINKQKKWRHDNALAKVRSEEHLAVHIRG